MICGFLDPKGKLHPCCKWEHVSKARELVDKYANQLHRTDKYEFCEDVLLKNGWICFRAGDVYKGIYDHDRKVLFITEEQMCFLEKNRQEFNLHQIADIEKMLRDFGDLHRWCIDDSKEDAR